MENIKYVLPTIILILGLFILFYSKGSPFVDEMSTDLSYTKNTTITKPIDGAGLSSVETIQEKKDKKINEFNSSEAYQYILLSAIIFIAFLVLPRLQNISISPTGATLNLLDKAQQDVQNLINATDPNINMDPNILPNIKDQLISIKTSIQNSQEMLKKRK